MSVGRITNLMVSQTLLAEINQSQATLDNTEQELSTGLSINQPSDNPYGASLAVQLNGQLSDLSTYSDNVADGTSWSQASASALTSIQNETQRAQALLVQAGNGANSQSDLDDIADEVDQLTASIKSTADTQYDGQYIFSGTATSTAPYTAGSTDTYQGNGSSVTRAIGPGTSVAVNADLGSVLGNGTTPGDGQLLDTLRTISADLRSGNTSALTGTDLTDLQTNLSSLTQLSTQVGSVQDQLSLASTRISDLQTSVTAQLSNDQDANMASTMTTYSNEQAAFTAALKAGANIVQTSLMDFLSN